MIPGMSYPAALSQQNNTVMDPARERGRREFTILYPLNNSFSMQVGVCLLRPPRRLALTRWRQAAENELATA